MNLLVFDIETIPDVQAGRILYELGPDLSDDEVAKAMFLLRREKTGTDFLPHHLQKVIAISAVFRHKEKLFVKSMGDLQADEKTLINTFYKVIDDYTPTLVSWNGGSFDLPVLHYRGLLHQVTASCYWDMGTHDKNFKYNNYLNRYHDRHTDLMDTLACYRSGVPLDELAVLLGFPGKMGMSGNKVWDAYQQGELEKIRNYCETDVLNTYLVYLRYQLFRGQLDQERLAKEEAFLREILGKENKAHLTEFLTAWNKETF